jgi:signal transduction histidine kinase
MDNSEKAWFYTTLIVGTLLIFTLGVMIVWLIFNFQRKLFRNELRLQKELTRVGIQSQEKERARIAQQLHDDVNALLSAAKMQIAFLPEILHQKETATQSILESKKLLEMALTHIRNLSHELSPTFLATFGLQYSLRQFFESMKEILQVNFLYQVAVKIPQEQKLSLYRIVLELTQNTLKHAQAKKIDINIQFHPPNKVELWYQDDGIGIQGNLESTKGIGMKNIESRVNASQGEISYPNVSKGFCAKIVLFI